MTSKAQRRKNRKRVKADLRAIQGELNKSAPQPPRKALEATRPTKERLARGVWFEGSRKAPLIDMAEDMIGRLAQERKLTPPQVDAARLFQQLRADYVAELDVTGFKSCLAGGSGGYDSGDGNPEAKRAYEALQEKIGRVKVACLVVECEKAGDQHPWSLDVLRTALDAVGGRC